MTKSTLLRRRRVIWVQSEAQGPKVWIGLLINHSCVLGVTRIKECRLSSRFQSKVHLDKGELLFRLQRQSVAEVCEVKVLKQIILGSISHLMKLPEVTQSVGRVPTSNSGTVPNEV